jgi:hypothetical protein
MSFIDSEKDMMIVAEHFRTGVVRPQPVVYQNFYYPDVKDQVFGVNVEQYCLFHKVKEPPLIKIILDYVVEMLCFECIKLFSNYLAMENRLQTFHDALNSTEISILYLARSELNRKHSLSTENLKSEGYSLSLLVELLRRYFMELPVPLLTFENYDFFRILYLCKDVV